MQKLELSKFYYYDEMEQILEKWQSLYPEKMKMKTLYVTEEKRNVRIVTITDFSDENPEGKGAYYVQAGVHSAECGGITAVLGLMDSLLNEDDSLLKELVFYIVPCVNPDGMFHAMTENYPVRSKTLPRYEGEENVLIPADIDGNGLVLHMRRKNPDGNMKSINGIMLKREPDDKDMPFYDEFYEGYVENYIGGDLKVGIRNVDYNRCYPTKWTVYENENDYPFICPEIEAVVNFVKNHTNIFAGIDFHCGQNGILRPSLYDDSEYHKDDLSLMLSIGKLAEETVGFTLFKERYEYRKEANSPIPLNGNSNVWMYDVMGISHYVIELGNGFNSMGMSTKEYFKVADDLNLMSELRDFHEKKGSKIFYDWKPFEHPELGEVEIGGFIHGRAYYMHPDTLGKVVPKTTDFIKKHIALRPKLKLDNVCSKVAENNMLKITATLTNEGEMGTTVMKGSSGELSKIPVKVYLTEGTGSDVIDGNIRYIDCLDAHQKISLEWIIERKDVSLINIIAEHPKTKKAKAKLIIN